MDGEKSVECIVWAKLSNGMSVYRLLGPTINGMRTCPAHIIDTGRLQLALHLLPHAEGTTDRNGTWISMGNGRIKMLRDLSLQQDTLWT